MAEVVNQMQELRSLQTHCNLCDLGQVCGNLAGMLWTITKCCADIKSCRILTVCLAGNWNMLYIMQVLEVVLKGARSLGAFKT